VVSYPRKYGECQLRPPRRVRGGGWWWGIELVPKTQRRRRPETSKSPIAPCCAIGVFGTSAARPHPLRSTDWCDPRGRNVGPLSNLRVCFYFFFLLIEFFVLKTRVLLCIMSTTGLHEACNYTKSSSATLLTSKACFGASTKT